MTFWTDARPATPRFRWRRGPRRPRGSGKQRRARVLGLAAVVAVIVVAATTFVVRTGHESPPAAAVSARRGDRSAQPRVIPESWAQTLRDDPQSMLTDARGVIVIGSAWVTEVGTNKGTMHWQARTKHLKLNRAGALHGDTILLSTEAGFVARERETGRQRWRLDLTTETPGPVALVGPGGTPAVAVVSTEEGGLAGLDIRTGAMRWSRRYSGRVLGVPAVDDVSGSVIMLWQDDLGARVQSVDGATGLLRWQHAVFPLAGSPVITDGPPEHRIVVIGSGKGNYESDVRAFALADGAVGWRVRVPASFQPGNVPLVDGNAVVVVDQLGNATRLDLADGQRRWSTDTGSVVVDGHPVRAGSAILFTNLAGEVLTLDRATGTVRARRRATGFPTDLVVAHDRVLVAQRLVEERQLQAFPANRIAAPARKAG